MICTGQGRGHGAKVGFFSCAYEGSVFPLFRGISGDGEVDHRFNVGIFCDVRANERGGTAELLDFCDDIRAFFFTSAGEDHLCASTGKFGGGRLTDAGGPSGRQCDFF